MDMKQWVKDQIAAPVKKALPVLTFPAAEKMGVTTKELIYSPDLQAEAMMYIHDHTDMAAVLAFMDLSVEAEAFGSTIRYSDNEVPTVIGSIVDEDSNVDLLEVPDPREGRTGVCIEGVRKVAERVSDKPVIAGNIGPFSLAGRLMDVNEVMFLCYDEPDLVHAVLNKVTDFIIAYTKELKAAGADGVMMAEPLAGLLSPDLTEEFSNPYVKRIVDETQDDEFIVIVHNCGSSVKNTIDSIVATGAAGLHLGNAVDMAEMMPHIPEDVVCFGNVDPAAQFCHGTAESVYAATVELLEACSQYPNFIVSSGCDIPQLTPWENIEAFFSAVEHFYADSVDEDTTAAAAAAKPAPTTMTSRERFFAALSHEPVDRVPVHPFVAGTNRILTGATFPEWASSAELIAKGYIEMAKMFPEEDCVLVVVDFTVEASAWGQPVIYNRNNPGRPDGTRRLVPTADDYGNIKPVDALASERMVMHRDACKIVVDELGNEKPVFAYVMGPLSTLSLMRGQRKIRRDFSAHADDIRQAVENVTETLVQFANMLMETGIDGIMWDTYFAGSSNMTREQWTNIERDSVARLAQVVIDKGGINLVHSCQSGAYFDLQIEALQPAAISFLHPAFGCDSLASTKQQYGDKVALMGAVTPWNAVHGTDLEWDQECKQVIEEIGGDTGFVLAPGCFYPANASLGRVKRMIDVAVSATRK
ncbi:MAG TPA: hypothetical protein DCP91_11510 [Eggerthellaceae bacterium]|nr:hypothetical protein [Eggerthellaceae bacterium]